MSEILVVIGGLALVVVAGWAIARFRILGKDAAPVLAQTVFNVATPALLIVTLSGADLQLLLTRTALVTAVTTTAVAVVAMLVLRLWLRRSVGETTIGALAASYLNAGNIGLPLAVYLFGNPLVVVPTLLFQLLVLAPASFAILESTGGTRDRQGIMRGVGRSLRNPIIIGAVTGVALSALPFDLPEVLRAPLELIGAAAPPLGLIVLGMSLAVRQESVETSSRWPDVALVVTLRCLVHPLAAWGLGTAIGLEGAVLYGVVAMTALPTAQNVFVYSLRYAQGQQVARATQLTTTALAVPILLVVTWLLG